MIKIFMLVFLVIVLGRVIFVSFVNNEKPEPEWLVIGLSSEKSAKVKEIQTILKAGGFYEGQPDGILGDGTRKAIRQFQRKSRIKQSGLVDRQTIDAINKWKEVQSQSANDLQLRNEALKGISTGSAFEFVWSKDKAGKIKQVQTALVKAGYFKGKVDGRNGPRTRRALKAFQKAQGLAADGVAGEKTMKQLEKFLMTEETS